MAGASPGGVGSLFTSWFGGAGGGEGDGPRGAPRKHAPPVGGGHSEAMPSPVKAIDRDAGAEEGDEDWRQAETMAMMALR